MEQSTFDIFRGATDEDAVWLDAVEGLENAVQHMEEIAALSPGRYFICRQQGHAVLARIDTRGSAPPSVRNAKNA